MKQLVFLIFFLLGCMNAYSQNWKDDIYESGSYAVIYKNEEKGKQTIQSREDIVLINDADTITIKIMKPEGGKLAFIGTVDGTDNCMPNEAPIFIEFSNNVTENFPTQTKENCTGNVRFNIGGKWKRKKTIALLKQNLVRKISIGGIDENHFYFLTREEALDLRKTINCVLYLQD